MKFLLYFLIGIVISNYNTKAAAMYFTVLPIQFYFLRYHFKHKNFMLTCLFAIFLVSMGLSPVFFFYNSEEASAAGYFAVADYDFSLFGYYHAYLKVFCFFLVLHLLSIKFRTRNALDVINVVNSFVRGFAKNQGNLSHDKLFYFTALFFCIISVWMYNIGAGITGIKPPHLPFHLSGILYYLRGIIIPPVLLFLYFGTKDKNKAFIMMSLCATIGGFSACSKGLAIMLLAPVSYANYIVGHKLKSLLGAFLSVVLFALIALCREIVFMYETIEYNLVDVFYFSLDAISKLDAQWTFTLFNSFAGRLYGANTIVLADQFHLTNISDMISYYTGSSLEQIIPDYTKTVFGLDLSDTAFGVAIGYLGSMILLSSGSFSLIIFQAIYIYVVLHLLESQLRKCLGLINSQVFQLLAISIASYSTLILIMGVDLTKIYMSILTLYMLPKVYFRLQKSIFSKLSLLKL